MVINVPLSEAQAPKISSAQDGTKQKAQSMAFKNKAKNKTRAEGNKRQDFKVQVPKIDLRIKECWVLLKIFYKKQVLWFSLKFFQSFFMCYTISFPLAFI